MRRKRRFWKVTFARWLSGALLLLALTAAPRPAAAYYDDVHYSLTYYLARAIGYTPEQAHRIASANLSIDYDPDTEPVQQEAQFNLWRESFSLNHRIFIWVGRERAQRPRIDFHAFMDCLAYPGCLGDERQKAIDVIPTKRNILWDRALSSGNPGAFLHFLMDEIPHAGYPSDNGHWTAFDVAALDGLPLGAATDYLAFPGHHNEGWEARNRPMIADSIQRLKDFMTHRMNPEARRQYKPGMLPRSPDWINEIRPALAGLVAANSRIPPTITADGLQMVRNSAWGLVSAAAKDWSDAFLSSLPLASLVRSRPSSEQMRNLREWYQYEAQRVPVAKEELKTESEPNYGKARAEIDRALKSNLHVTDSIPEPVMYALTAEGLPDGSGLDDWVLFGDLTVTLTLTKGGETPRSTSDPIFVRILGVPDYEGQDEWEMAKDTTNGEPVNIAALPVGKAVVEVKYQQQTLLRQAIAISRRKNNVNLTLNLSHDEDKAFEDVDALLRRMKELEVQAGDRSADAKAHGDEFERQLGLAGAALKDAEGLVKTAEANAKRWQAEIAQLEQLVAQQPAVEQRAQAAARSAHEAEQAAAEQARIACVDAVEYGDGSADFLARQKKRADEAVREAKRQAKAAASAGSDAQSAAQQLISASQRVQQLQNSIAQTGAGEPLAAAQAALDEAKTHLDALTDLAAQLEAIRHEADEIMDQATRKLDAIEKQISSPDQANSARKAPPKDAFKSMRKSFEQSHEAIIKHHEQWKNIRTDDLPKLEAMMHRRTAAEAAWQSVAAQIAALSVPGVDSAGCEADADSARGSADAARASAERAESCPKEPQAPDNLITKLSVRLEQTSKEGSYGAEATEYVVVAVLTTRLKAAGVVTCTSSLNEQPSAVRMEEPRDEFPLELHRYDFKPGQEVTVTCSLKPDGNTVSATARAPGGSIDELLSQMRELEGRAKTLADSAASELSKRQSEAARIAGQAKSLLSELSGISAELDRLLAARRDAPATREAASAAAQRARDAAGQVEQAATAIQKSAGEVCAFAEAAADKGLSEMQQAEDDIAARETEFKAHARQITDSLKEAKSAAQEAERLAAQATAQGASSPEQLSSRLQTLANNNASLAPALARLRDQAAFASIESSYEPLAKQAEGVSQRANALITNDSPRKQRRLLEQLQQSYQALQSHGESIGGSRQRAGEGLTETGASLETIQQQLAAAQRKLQDAEAASADARMADEAARLAQQASSDAQAAGAQKQSAIAELNRAGQCESGLLKRLGAQAEKEVRAAIAECRFKAAQGIISGLHSSQLQPLLQQLLDQAVERERLIQSGAKNADTLFAQGWCSQAMQELGEAARQSICPKFQDWAKDRLVQLSTEACPQRAPAQAPQMPPPPPVAPPVQPQGTGIDPNTMTDLLGGLMDAWNQGVAAGGGGTGWTPPPSGQNPWGNSGGNANAPQPSGDPCAANFYMSMSGPVCQCANYHFETTSNACVPGPSPFEGKQVPGFTGFGGGEPPPVAIPPAPPASEPIARPNTGVGTYAAPSPVPQMTFCQSVQAAAQRAQARGGWGVCTYGADERRRAFSECGVCPCSEQGPCQ